MNARLTAIALALALCGCGGQAEPLTDLPVLCYTPVDKVTPAYGCAGQLQGSASTDPVQSVHTQAHLSGPLILWTGRKADFSINAPKFQTLIDTAKQYPGKFPYVFLYDEPGWCDTACAWKDEPEVQRHATIAHAAGFKTLINIMPDVILDDRFSIQNINSYDVITIDVYPSARPGSSLSPNFRGCYWNGNPYADLFYCASQRLRSHGFSGPIVYIYQAFGIRGLSNESLRNQLSLQRQAVAQARAMGASAVMPWGLYLGAAEAQSDGSLYQLAGTEFEWLVTP